MVACFLSLTVLGACTSESTSPPVAQVAAEDLKPFGRECDRSAECEFGACIQVSAARSVCSAGCDPTAGHNCPEAANWACLTPNETEQLVCACQSDVDFEVCGDGLDNDCDGLVDNCLTCAGLLVPADSVEHCGGCGRRCLPGSVCLQGQCECPEGVADGECLMDPFAPECVDAADCDDGIACTEEICRAGRCGSTVVPARCGQAEVCDLRRGGCVEAQPCGRDADCLDDDPCTTREICDPATRVCLWLPLDGDGDGDPPRVCGGADCDDSNPSTFTGAPDLCDGVDNSCNGAVDQPLVAGACAPNQACDAGRCVCTDGLVECAAGACVDTASDPLNCGGCSNVCPQGATCSEGNCTCDGDLAACGSGCADLQADALNCGGCDIQCAAGHVCSTGVCVDVDECATGTDTCSDRRQNCVNTVGGFTCSCKPGFSGSLCTDTNECLLTSNNNCAVGACVNTAGSFECQCPTGYTGDGLTCEDINECASIDCGANGSCVNSAGGFYCDCALGYSDDGNGGCAVSNACQAGLLEPEQKWCAGLCRTVVTDGNHCGDCGVACGTGTCVDGECTCDAGSGLSFCPGAGCVSLANDEPHCGECGNPCPSGGSCVSSVCICSPGEVDCNGVCTALGTNNNCSACGDGCALGGSCSAESGGDECACPFGEVDCNGTCVDMLTDESNCGTCGTSCRQRATCETGSCACQAGYPDICGDTCVNELTDELNCGGCGTTCAQGATCSAGACACDGAGESVCNDTCVALATDELNCGSCGQSCDVLCSSASCIVVVEVATGAQSTCVLLSDDTVWCWGVDTYGTLGDGVGSSSGHIPRPVTGLTDVAKIAMGSNHACAVSNTGTLSCWGYNAGNTFLSTGTSHMFSAVEVRTGVDDVALGEGHTCVVLTGGTIECIGADSMGQHGDGEGSSSTASWSGPSGLTGVDKLVSGERHLCALKSGKLLCWGDNSDGQLGLGNTTGDNVFRSEPVEVPVLSGIDDVSAGGAHTCAVIDGQVTCWGQNSNFQAGVSTTLDVPAPTELVTLSNAVSVHAGTSHTCAKLDTESIVCWGNRLDGRLGDGISSGATNLPQALAGSADINALSLGGRHSCGIDSLGDVYCWGDGNSSRAIGRFSDAVVITEVASWSQVTR